MSHTTPATLTFSANLGFLWRELSLPAAIRAAKKHGFAAVECHWPFSTPAKAVAEALAETELEMLGINTHRGTEHQNGLSAIPGEEDQARKAIDQAIEYALAIDAKNIHVMAGTTSASAGHDTFVRNLRYACRMAEPHGITILIEPLNPYDAPGYFLTGSQQATDIIAEVEAANLKLMFDCYHLQILEGDLTRRLSNLLPIIGHIQIAAVPDRGEPDHGEIDYGELLRTLAHLGYRKPVGAEYKPRGSTEEGLSWMQTLAKAHSDSAR